jgi:tryptophan aminotransferase
MNALLLVRGLYPLETKPGMISLLAGKPNPAMFPFTSLSFGAHDPADQAKVHSISVDPAVLSQGLQYAATDGIPEFVEWLTVMQELEHKRDRSEGWRVTVTGGSQDAIYKVRGCDGHTSDSGLSTSI